MPYQYKREPLSEDEVICLANARENLEEKIVIQPLLDIALG